MFLNGEHQNYLYFNLTINKLPYGLKKLEFEDKFNKPIDKLPDTVEELRLGYFKTKEEED